MAFDTVHVSKRRSASNASAESCGMGVISMSLVFAVRRAYLLPASAPRPLAHPLQDQANVTARFTSSLRKGLLTTS